MIINLKLQIDNTDLKYKKDMKIDFKEKNKVKK